MKTTKHLPLSKSSKHNLSAKVHQLSEEWELFKIQSKSNSEQRTEEVSSNLVKTLKKSLATPLTKENTPNLSHKILYRKSLTPLIKSKNSNFEVLISKCKLFQEGLYKTVNLNRLKRREDAELEVAGFERMKQVCKRMTTPRGLCKSDRDNPLR